MPSKQQFEAAKAKSATLASKPDNANLLKLYALYKQGSIGDINSSRPTGFDFVAAAKWDAWHQLNGMSQEEAMQSYIDLVEELI